jgi:hypothetical protein
MAVIGATSSTSSAAAKSAPPPQTPADVARVLVARNTNKIGHVDTKALVQDVKKVSRDVQAQRDVAAAAAKQIDNRDDRSAFVKELKQEGVARKPGFFNENGRKQKARQLAFMKAVAALSVVFMTLANLALKQPSPKLSLLIIIQQTVNIAQIPIRQLAMQRAQQLMLLAKG